MSKTQPPIPSRRPAMTPAQTASVTARIQAVLASGHFYSDDGLVRRLEDAVEEHQGRVAVATASGMDALDLVLDVIRPGSDVAVPANCFQAIPALVRAHGRTATPIDIDPISMALSPRPLLNRPGPPGIVVWVHHAGMVAASAQEAIGDLRAAGWFVIEDCAYVVPASSPGSVGRWGDVALWSLGPTKPLAGAGGGLLLPTDVALAEELAARRSHGGQEPRWSSGQAFLRDRRLSELRAAVALTRWRDVDRTRANLEHVSAAYLAAVSEHDGDLMGGRRPEPTWGKFVVDLPMSSDSSRVSVWRRLAAQGIGCSVMYERPWFDYPALAVADRPGTWDDGWERLRHLLGRTLCLPYYEGLRADDAHRVISTLVADLSTESRALE